MALEVARAVHAAASERGLRYVFKSSYLKDNRTSARSFTGLGLEEGLRILARVRETVGVPVLTDVHELEEIEPVAAVVDALQIPAFLCRQGRLIERCAATGRTLNVKKGQFLAPADMVEAVAKIRAVRPEAEILLTERGSAFGYRDLVVDMRSIALMRGLGCRVVFDATHSLQRPGRGGDRRWARPLARAALAAGAEGIFAEIHPRPERARCDASTQLPMGAVGALIDEWAAVGELIERLEKEGPQFEGPNWPGLETPSGGPGS